MIAFALPREGDVGLFSNLWGSKPGRVPDPSPRPSPVSEPDFVVVDVETACSRSSSICQIGIVGFAGGSEVLSYETLVDPRDEFGDRETSIHGITAKHVRGHPHFGSLHSIVSRHLKGRVAVAHNAAFDRGAIAAACQAHSRPEISARWLCSVKVARHAWPDLPNHRLPTLADHLGIRLTHHDALSDARAAGMVIVRAMEHTGLGLEDWFGDLSGGQRRERGSLKRIGGDGPLAGECIAVTGELSVPKQAFADEVAAAGGAVTGAPTRKTTILVLGAQDSSSFAGKDKSSKHIKALDLMAAGQPIRILSETEFRALL